MLSPFRLAESPPHFNMVVWEFKLPAASCRECARLRGSAGGARWGTALLGGQLQLSGSTGSFSKRPNARGLRSWRISGGIIASAADPGRQQASSHSACGRCPGGVPLRDTSRVSARSAACRDQPSILVRTTGRPASARSPSVSPRTSWPFPESWPASGSFPGPCRRGGPAAPSI
jgi:hypothetical protein